MSKEKREQLNERRNWLLTTLLLHETNLVIHWSTHYQSIVSLGFKLLFKKGGVAMGKAGSQSTVLESL